MAHNEKLGFKRDPSFSGWGDKDGLYHQNGAQEGEIVKASDVDDNFELPVLQEVGFGSEYLEGGEDQRRGSGLRGLKINGTGNMNMISTPSPRRGNRNENYASFDIESASTNTNNVNKHRDIPPSSRNPIALSDILKTMFLILMWYFFSTLLTVYNKTLLGDDMGKFPAPLLMNTVHFAMQAILSKGITYFWSHRFEPSVPMSRKDYYMRVFKTHALGAVLTWTLPFTVVPTSLATALDINLSNVSLVFISVTFATMCKSASPIFLLIFAFAFSILQVAAVIFIFQQLMPSLPCRLETPSVKLGGIILIISVGVLLTVAKETEFEFWGFIFVMLAAVMSGFRWSMTQILLQVLCLKNPLVLMSYVTPVMAVGTGLFSLILDPWEEFRRSSYFDSSWHITRSGLLMLFGGTLAFFMVLTEYVLVSITSAVTVTIAGVVKEAVTILYYMRNTSKPKRVKATMVVFWYTLSSKTDVGFGVLLITMAALLNLGEVAVFYFHDDFTWLKGAGLVTIMFGVSLFNWYKYQKFQNRLNGDDTVESDKNIPAKYVILEDMEEEESMS
ncbi:sugar phosphate transporter domain-containing protein [Artemisia annua]|uniref:Sugar phosphate transporter domain-containing protein n=1 Tax=Artemisia annua TaxID=35608 RepID=A0A2U1PTK8_ARTAN|nr:sugar phosphate transporter domain-containing protein [Artemisia annua]